MCGGRGLPIPRRPRTLSEPPEYVRDFFHQTDAKRCRLSIWIFKAHEETPLLAKFCLKAPPVGLEGIRSVVG